MATIIITGGTGLVGKALTKLLVDKGYTIIVLTRMLPAANQLTPGVQYALWDVKAQTIDVAAVQKADYIIHLAGAGVVEKRWTASYKEEILRSRIDSSALLVNTLKQHPHQVKAVISASAIGWYGADQGGKPFEETAPAAPGFLGDTCKQWEASIEPVTALGIRLVKIRIGIVLSDDGGALKEFKKPVQLGVAGILGNGNQVISWVHIDDLCRIMLHAIQQGDMSGAYNAVAPAPVTNKTLTIELAKKLKGKFFIPLHVPAFVLKMMLGESSIEVLKSTTVSSEKIKSTGFTFLYPSLEAALLDLCKK